MQIGDRFEDQLRQRMALNGIPDAIGCEEEWLQERLSCFFNPALTSREVLYPNGRWIQVMEQSVGSGILRTLVDITHTKTLSLQVQDSEQRFMDFTSCAADIFWETDTQFNYQYLGGRVEELLGQPAEALYGTPLVLLLKHALVSESPADIEPKLLPWLQQLSFHRVKTKLLLPNSGARTLSVSGKPFYTDANEFSGYRGTLTDITEPDRLHQQLEYQATHDELTGLLNRRSFEVELERAFSSTRSGNTVHSLCYLDLDHFKIVNDNGGHDAGDMLLKQVASLIQQQVRSTGAAARLGGDEFGLLLCNCSLTQCQVLADQVNQLVSNLCMAWNGETYQVGISIGLVEINQHTSRAAEAMTNADRACYTAKDLGRNRVYTYQPDDIALLKRQTEAQQVQEIRRAMKQPGRMRLYFQPIVATNEPFNSPSRYELLPRLFDEADELSPPGMFIAAAERYDLMGEVDRWVIRYAFNEYADLLTEKPQLNFSINLSGQSMSDSRFRQYVEDEFITSRCPPAQICFEITETAAIDNLSLALEFMAVMRNLGCRFALDDFGSGLSSLSQLQRLPVDYLKIDGSLIEHISESDTDKIMVDSICSIGRSMKLAVIAEYVEDIATLRILEKLGVDYVQGYFVGRPAPEISAI